MSTQTALRAIALLALLALPAQASIRYVDASLTTGANDGSSWADAYQGVAAIPVAVSASIAGDQVWVRAGTYKPTATATRSISIVLKNGVEIYGGFAGTETLLTERDYVANPTILTGDLGGNDPTITDNSFHVVNGNATNATAVLDGFRITAGNANTAGSNQDRGGGILCVGGTSPTIRNCDFVANRCTFGGGAGYVNASSPTFTNCLFEGNVGGSFGGAFDCATNVLAKWDRCTFRNNSAARAGAVELFASSSATLTNCLFVGNTATGSGSGGALFISNSNPLIRNCTITGNSATASTGGGIQATGSNPTIANCIFWNNSGTGGAMNAANQINPTTLTTVSYSIVTGGYAGTANTAVDPLFTNAGGGDYTLSAASSAIDAGNNASVPAGILADLAGNPRFADVPSVPDTGAGTAPIVDRGAYEVPAGTSIAFCFGDGLSGVPCPCGNNSPVFAGEGCLNSLGAGGKLDPSGNASVSADTFALVGSQMPNSSALYFQGTTQIAAGAGAAFGDGLRCAGGTIIRLGTKTNVAGTSTYPTGGDLSVSVRGGIVAGGTVRTYQCWYRNADPVFCTPSTFNLTNGLQVTWAP